MKSHAALIGYMAGICLLLLLAFAPYVSASETPPNFVVILLDDIDFDEIGPYDYRTTPTYASAVDAGITTPKRLKGRPALEQKFLTPAIDSLARDGAVFERFYVTTSVCTPSRYSLLTGRYASRSLTALAESEQDEPIYVHFNALLESRETNLVRALADLGYVTGIVGKWHNGVDGGDGGHPGRGEIEKSTTPDDAAMLTQIRTRYAQGLEYLRNGIGFEFAERIFFGNIKDLHLPDSLSDDNLEWITEGAINFIEEYGNAERPFFLYVALTVPHGQAWDRQPLLSRLLRGEKLSKPARSNILATPIGLLQSAPEVMPGRETLATRLREADAVEGAGAEEILWMDDSIQAILDAIDAKNLSSNTIVWVLSDHQSRGKLTAYEGSRVPSFIRWPDKIEPGTRVSSVAANIDIAPTLLNLAGATNAPADLLKDGEDLTPLLLGINKGTPRALLLEANYQRALVTDRYKLVVNLDTEWFDQLSVVSNAGKAAKPNASLVARSAANFPAIRDDVQLYDLHKDVLEQHNMINAEEFKPEARRLSKELQTILSQLPHREERFLPSIPQ